MQSLGKNMIYKNLMRFKQAILAALLAFTISSSIAAQATTPQINLEITEQTDKKAQLNLKINLDAGQRIYANTVSLSVDTPILKLSEWQVSKNPTNQYDSQFHEQATWTGDFTISAEIENPTDQPVNDANLHFNFLTNQSKTPQIRIFPLNLFKVTSKDKNAFDQAQTNLNQDQVNLEEQIEPARDNAQCLSPKTSLSQFLQVSLTNSDSLFLRLALIYLMGILMSLTPCIYPMLPITAGVLQAQGSNSMARSFVLSLSYSLGTATTFAIFGLIAASTGHLFGQLLINPWFILLIVSILTYLGGSMFGWYEVYIPTFMQSSTVSHKKGSLLSAFVMGVISGSIASPCLSPGLALLLTIVATLGNQLLGFLMLFVFGLGLSLPLLIIGTFSSSINVLPQSGQWMVEIKKIFGWMLFGMSIYFLNNLLPNSATKALQIGLIFGAGVYYLQNISSDDSKLWRWLKNILGLSLIIFSIIFGTKIIYQKYYAAQAEPCSAWMANYEQALELAKNQKQLLLIDCGADWCSICHAIDRQVFENPTVKQAICHFIQLKVDATDQNNPTYQTLKEKYQIMGVPTILVINPQTGVLVQRWGSELYDLPIEEFIKQLESK